MKTFTNLSQFKNQVIIGTRLSCIYHMDLNGRDKNGNMTYKDKVTPDRPVSIVQTNAIALTTTKKDGTLTDSWLQWPKASECKIIDNNTLEVYEEETKVLTYQIIN